MEPITPKMKAAHAKQRELNAQWRKENPDWPTSPSPEKLKALLKAVGKK